MKIFMIIFCVFLGHDWRNDTKYPVHGYDAIPHAGSYCDRCGTVAK